ncbi:MAG: hypothetical protein F6J87_25155 [Spirulina sp. SIO3F2]|nr:hypothetical protein [Spirulina sp. SIO3F2]
MNYSFKNAWQALLLACFCIVCFCLSPAYGALADEGNYNHAYIYHAYDSPIVDEPSHDSPITSDSVRNTMYCEIMPLFYDKRSHEDNISDDREVTESYNTYPDHDCDLELWEDEDLRAESKREFLDTYSGEGELEDKALDVILNGPRLWVLDKIDSPKNGVPQCIQEVSGKEFSYLEGVPAALGAQIEYMVGDPIIFASPNEPPYFEQTVRRWTKWTWTYKEDNPNSIDNMVYELVHHNSGDPGEDDVYIMQSIDLNQVASPGELPDLVDNPDFILPPDGNWEYRVRQLSGEDYELEANGNAVVIHDSLGNGYQRTTHLDSVHVEASCDEVAVQ